MVPVRRISGAFKDIPGGQILGPTYDYTHRLIEFEEQPDLPADPVPADQTDSSILAEKFKPASVYMSIWRNCSGFGCI